MTGDDRWYEAAFVVGITNALNVVADGLGGAPPMPRVEPATAAAGGAGVFRRHPRVLWERAPVATFWGARSRRRSASSRTINRLSRRTSMGRREARIHRRR